MFEFVDFENSVLLSSFPFHQVLKGHWLLLLVMSIELVMEPLMTPLVWLLEEPFEELLEQLWMVFVVDLLVAL